MSQQAMQVLSVASECAPLLKTGGLADVVGALPAALEPLGWHSRILLPAYRGLLENLGAQSAPVVWTDADLFGGPARVHAVTAHGLDLLLLDAPHLFDRPGGPYNVDGHDHPDNHVRFAALSWVGARLAIEGTEEGWRPDIVHAHDWQAGLLPSYLKYSGSDVPSVMTIHNIAFQGVFGPEELDHLRLPTWDFHPEALEYHGLVSALKAGLVHATRVTTVSPNYAEELTSSEFGFGLEGVIASRRDRGELHGIINGIDTTVWNPETDPQVLSYSAALPDVKAENRRALLEEFSLTEPVGPLAVVITRLSHQKGIDLLLEALPGFLDSGGAAVVLGSGDPGYESGLGELAVQHPESMGLRIGYDEALSHRMYAGGDLVLVPSRFEPCGLTQLYGLRYGALPLVSNTGGLRDTVVDATPENLEEGVATGFVFSGTTSAGLAEAFSRAVELYADREAWLQMRERAMGQELDWSTSAARYGELFAQLVR